MNDKLEVVSEVVDARMKALTKEFGEQIIAAAGACNAIVAVTGAMAGGKMNADEGGTIIAESLVLLITCAKLDPKTVQKASEAIFYMSRDIEEALNSDHTSAVSEILAKIRGDQRE